MRQRYSHREGIGEHLVISDDILVEQHFVDVVKEARYSRAGGRGIGLREVMGQRRGERGDRQQNCSDIAERNNRHVDFKFLKRSKPSTTWSTSRYSSSGTPAPPQSEIQSLAIGDNSSTPSSSRNTPPSPLYTFLLQSPIVMLSLLRRVYRSTHLGRRRSSRPYRDLKMLQGLGILDRMGSLSLPGMIAVLSR